MKQRTNLPSRLPPAGLYGWFELEGAEEWIGFNIGEEYNILRMVIYPAQNGTTYAQGFPTSYAVDISDNGKTWQTVYTADNVPNADELTAHTINLGNVKTKYIRFPRI